MTLISDHYSDQNTKTEKKYLA